MPRNILEKEFRLVVKKGTKRFLETKMNKKKAQVRMAETIAVLIIFMFIMFIGYSFYAGMQQRGIAEQKREIRSKEAVQIALKTYFLPELQCSFGTRLETGGCIDSIKFEKLRDLINDPTDDSTMEYYRWMFGNTEIKLIEVYPGGMIEGGGSEPYLLYSSKIDKSSSRQTQMPVAIYNPLTRRYGFGYLTVDYYFKI